MAAKKGGKTNRKKAKTLAEKIAAEVTRAASKGLNAARIFFEARVRETLSVRAPRKVVKGPFGGIKTWRATTPAQHKAPPRMVSGEGRRQFTSRMVNENTAWFGSTARSPRRSGKYPKGFPYMRYHEVRQRLFEGSGKHKYVAPTADKYRRELAKIVGRPIKEIQVRR